MTEVVADESHDEEDLFEKEFNDLADGNEPSTDELGEVDNKEEVNEQIEEEANDENEAVNADDSLALRIKELEGQNAELEHSLKSNTGRVSAYQKKINEYEEADKLRLEEVPKAEEVIEPSQFEEDYPDIAENVKSMMESNDKRWQEKFDARDQQQNEAAEVQQQDSYNASQVATLTEEFPDWSETEQSEDFQSWVAEQPNGIQSMISSRAAADHSYLLNAFEGQKSSKAGDIAAKREKKLAANVAVPNKNISKPAQVPDEFEAAFEHFATK